MMLFRRSLILIVDCQLSIAGTQTALAFSRERLSQIRKSVINNQQLTLTLLPGGER